MSKPLPLPLHTGPRTCAICGEPISGEAAMLANQICCLSCADKTSLSVFTCPRCNAVNYHARDAEHYHCRRCHLVTPPPPPIETELIRQIVRLPWETQYRLMFFIAENIGVKIT
jgi:hypothetical protein